MRGPDSFGGRLGTSDTEPEPGELASSTWPAAVLRAGGPSLRRRLASSPLAGWAGRLVVGSVRAQSMSWLRSADASMVWTLELARIYLAVLGCAAAGWAVGFGMGYRRGVNDAMTGDIIRTDHRVNAE